jgi:hypothetical protein
LNAASAVDSGGGRPSPCPSSGYATLARFGVRALSGARLLNYPVVDVEYAAEETRVGSTTPDLGFVLDANAQRCGVLLSGLYVREEESEQVLSQLPAHQRNRAAGVYSVLGWLTLLMQSSGSTTSSDPGPAAAALGQMRRLWSTEGRTITSSLRLQLVESDAVALMEALRGLPKDSNRDWSVVELRVRDGSSSMALADIEQAGNETLSARNFARAGNVTLRGTRDDAAALSLPHLTECTVSVSLEDLPVTKADEEELKRKEEDEGSDDEDEDENEDEDDWVTRRGLLDALAGGPSENDEAREEVQVWAVLDIILKVQPPSDDRTAPPPVEDLVGRVVQSLRSVQSRKEGGSGGLRPLKVSTIDVVEEK